MDSSILAGNIANAKKPRDFKIVGEVLSTEPIAIMMRKDDAEFKAEIDESIKKMMKSGAINKLYKQWFLDPIPPKGMSVGLELSENTKAAWASPNDKPAEDYVKK
jgi:glutamate/aspartate transport system substrate-binding protein